MPLEKKRLDVRRWDAAKLQKLNLFETARFFADVYCMEVGQQQKPHVHADSDKLYAVLEGTAVATVGGEEATLGPGEVVLCPAGVEHAIENRGPGRAAVLAFAAPHTHPPR
ncbi:MAG: cupin domain-containing protein [Anaeromyxobacteraceae bacterium]